MLNNWISFGEEGKNLILHSVFKVEIQCVWMTIALPTYELKIPAIST